MAVYSKNKAIKKKQRIKDQKLESLRKYTLTDGTKNSEVRQGTEEARPKLATSKSVMVVRRSARDMP